MFLNHQRFTCLIHTAAIPGGISPEPERHSKCPVGVLELPSAGLSLLGPRTERCILRQDLIRPWQLTGKESFYSRTPLRRTMGFCEEMDEDGDCGDELKSHLQVIETIWSLDRHTRIKGNIRKWA